MNGSCPRAKPALRELLGAAGWTRTSGAKLVRRAGFPHVRFHDLRHSHASQLLKQGVHPKIVSERLGHATVGLTLDTYSHVLPGVQEQTVEQFDAVMRAAMEGGKQ